MVRSSGLKHPFPNFTCTHAQVHGVLRDSHVAGPSMQDLASLRRSTMMHFQRASKHCLRTCRAAKQFLQDGLAMGH